MSQQDVLQEVLNKPMPTWYNNLSKKQEGIINTNGGQLVSSALARRRHAAELRQMVADLPSAFLQYEQSALEACDGLIVEMQMIAVKAAGMGISRDDIAKLLGIASSRLHRWIERGLQEEYPFSNFAQALIQAETFHDLDQENNAYEAMALQVKTTGAYIRMLERTDEKRKEEKPLFADLPLEQFTEEEFEAYDRRGIIPARFKNYRPSKSDQEQLEEDYSHIAIYRLKQELALAEDKIKYLSEEVIKLKAENEQLRNAATPEDNN